MSNPQNYEQIDRPYDILLQRGSQDVSAVSPERATNSGDTPSSTSTAPSGASGGVPTAKGAPTDTGQDSSANGSVEKMPVKSDGDFGDVWIKNFIRSQNWRPKTGGFYIDGRTGYAEFSNVFVSGNVQALTGSIGGFVISSSNLSATLNGNRTIVSGGLTAFSAGPAGAPTITITQAGLLTTTSALIGGWSVGPTYIKDAAGAVGMSSAATSEDDIRFWAGSTNPATALFRVTEAGVLTARSGTIGGFTITAQMLYGGIIQTSSSVGAVGTNGVIMDTAGLRGYSATLGQVFNIPTNGDQPTFSNGVILVSNMYSSNIAGGTIVGAIVTGGTLRTAAEGRRIEINSGGIQAINGALGVAYGDASKKYGDATRLYGTGVLVYINNDDVAVPFYVNQEQTVADLHLYNRSADPSGKAEVGDLAVVSGKLKICTSAGTPGTFVVVGGQS